LTAATSAWGIGHTIGAKLATSLGGKYARHDKDSRNLSERGKDKAKGGPTDWVKGADRALNEATFVASYNSAERAIPAGQLTKFQALTAGNKRQAGQTDEGGPLETDMCLVFRKGSQTSELRTGCKKLLTAKAVGLQGVSEGLGEDVLPCFF